MHINDAMKAAERGYKVAPVGKSFFVFYHPENGFQRATIGFSYSVSEFVPTPYEYMMVWEIYEKSPLKKVKDFFNRAFAWCGKLSSNPS